MEDQLTSNGKDDSRREHKKPWYKKPSILAVVISVLALFASVASSYFSYDQVNAARQQDAITAEQNTVTEQATLANLTNSIAQAPGMIAQQSGSLSASALATAQITEQTADLGDSEEAASLIKLLSPDDVTDLEYYETGLGFELSAEYGQAVTFFEKAGDQSSDPRIAADALRAAAASFYQLGLASEAEKNIRLAERAYDVPGVTNIAQENSVAYTELFDASYQISISCSTARSDVQAAEKVLAMFPKVRTVTINALLASDGTLINRCA